MKSKTPYWGAKPLVVRSEASKLTDSQAEAGAPNEGMKESGSAVATTTFLGPILTTALSTPNLGPAMTSRLVAPSRR